MVFFSKFKIQNIFSILFCILPLALVSGPFLSDLILSLIGIFFIIISVRNKLWIYYKNTFVYLFLAFYFLILLGSIFSLSPTNSLESSLFYFRYLFFTLGIIYLLNNEPKLSYYFGYVLFATILLVLIDAYIQYFTGYNLLGYEKWSVNRFSGFLKDEALGRYLAYLMPLLFATLSMKKIIYRYELIAAMLILILCDVLVYLTGERTSFLLLFLGTLIIVFNIKRYKYLRAICFVISIAIVFIITNYSPEIKRRVIDTSIQGFEIGSEDIKIINKHYDALYKTSYQIFLDHPIIGIGVKNFRIVCGEKKYYAEDSCSTHPHNTLLQFLSETGLSGTLFYLGFLIFCSFKLIIHFINMIFKRNDYVLEDYQVCLYACYIVMLWPLAPSLNFFNNWVSVLYFLPLPFLLIDTKKLYK